MRSALALLFVLVGLAPAAAKTLIQCRHPGSENVVISLNDRKQFGRVLSCILRSDFVADMTPCAPNGGYGLSRPTGLADLTSVVNRWQDYADHMGGVVGFGESAEAITFTGGFNGSSSGYTAEWTFDVNRLSGTAVLKQPGKPSVTYSCSAAKAKF